MIITLPAHFATLHRLSGFKVAIVADRPRMQLSADCPVTPAMRQETDQWLQQFFGMTNMLADGAYLIDTAAKTLFCNARTLENLLREEAQYFRSTSDAPR